MALVNAFGDIALDTSVQQVKTSVDALDLTTENVVTLAQAIAEQNALMMQMLNYMKSLGNVDTGYRQRVAVDSIAAGTITTVGTVTTVGSVTNVAAVGGFGYQQFQAPSQTAYNTGTLPFLVDSSTLQTLAL